MQTQPPPALEPYQSSSDLTSSTKTPTLPIIYTEHCAPASDAASERCAGQTMQSLSLPPLNSLPSSPFGRYQELGSGLVNIHSPFSPGRPEQHSYPSPPMSDSHSPARHPAHIVEPEGRPYPPRLQEPRPHPPANSLLNPRSAIVPQSIAQQRSLYLGEPPGRGHPMHYQSERPLDPPFASVHISQNYVYGYPPSGVSHYLGSPGAPGPQLQQAAIIAPQSLRQAKPARRTKAHVASACVNCKKAHLSCDVQRPCGRCVASGKQVSNHSIPRHVVATKLI